MAQAAKSAAQVLPFLILFTASPYAMYKTYTALDEAAEQSMTLTGEGLGLLFVTAFTYLFKKIYLDDLKWVISAMKSVREDLIIEEVQENSLYQMPSP